MSETSSHLDKARFLIARSRPEEARRELAREIAENPENGAAHALDSLCLKDLGRAKEALSTAERAIATDPELPLAHYSLAAARFDEEDYRGAEAATREALRLDPFNPAFHALLARTRIARRQWEGALEAAEQGLEIDAEDTDCINLRAIALIQLNRHDQAASAIEYAMANDPEDAMTHANRGWHLVEMGEYDRAMDHFRQALRFDPTHEWARHGVVELIKARNPIYRVMLRYFLWSSKLQSQTGWLLVIGGWFGYRFLRRLAETSPVLAPFLWPIIILYLVFVVLSWIASPVFDLMVRFHPFGKYALSREEIRASNWVGGMLLVAVLHWLVYLFYRPHALFVSALCASLMVIPIAGTFGCESEKGRETLGLYTFALAILATASVVFTFFSDSVSYLLFLLFTIGAFIFNLLANRYALQS